MAFLKKTRQKAAISFAKKVKAKNAFVSSIWFENNNVSVTSKIKWLTRSKYFILNISFVLMPNKCLSATTG